MHIPNVCTPNTILHTLPTIAQHPPAVAVNNYASPVGPALPHALAETTTSSMETSARVSHTPFLPACQYPAGLLAQLFCFLSLTLQTHLPPNVFAFFLSSPSPLPSLKIFNSVLSLPFSLPPFLPLSPPSDPAPRAYISSKTVVAPFEVILTNSEHWSRSLIGSPSFNITASAIDIDYCESMLYWISSVDKVHWMEPP